jgi:hypothetical protein
MSRGTLEARIERLEAKCPVLMPAAHRLILDTGESEAKARRSYELYTGRTIGPDDLVVLRVIVDPA